MAAALAVAPRHGIRASAAVGGVDHRDSATAARLAHQAALADPGPLRALVSRALDAARSAGAHYADVRLTRTVGHVYKWQTPVQRFDAETEVQGIGVRALVNGYWGFAAYDDVTTSDVMATLGRTAVAQATVNAKGPARAVDLARTPVAHDGEWTMPVQVDPFTVSYDEKLDFMMGIAADIANQEYGIGTFASIGFVKELRTFASSEGSFTTQTVYGSTGVLQVGTDADWETERSGGRTAEFLTSAGAGWEYVRNAPYQTRLAELLEDAKRIRRTKPVDIGRYDVVLDAAAMAQVLDQTLAMGTELDRAMGYFANSEGSSFLDDPLAMLGTYQVGSPLVTLTANRSMAGGGATVKWDEEGVEPSEITLVNKGILTDFQTTRESASWLAPYYQKAGRPVRSSGGASAAEATMIPRSTSPNFVLAPDATRNATFDDLVARTKSGYAIKGGYAYSDFQALNGTITGEVVYEIVNGKLGQAISGAGLAFRAPEFWKNVVAMGGASSAATFGSRYGRRSSGSRREYSSRYKTSYTIQAVPAVITQQAMTDYTRKT